MAEPFLAEVRIFGFNFPPRGWAQCDGQILPINQYQALFSLLGTTYGGDGRTTFALPGLRSRVPIHEGANAQSSHPLGQRGGAQTHSLTSAEGHSHGHDLMGTSTNATTDDPRGALPAITESNAYGDGLAGSMGQMSSEGGGSSPHNNMQPYLVVNFCIALQGLFPSRN